MNADTFVNYHLILFLFRVCSFFLVTLNVAEPKPYSHFVYRNTSAYERPATESDACNAVNVGLCVCVCCMFEKWLAGLHVVLCSPSLCFLLLLLSSCCQFVFSLCAEVKQSTEGGIKLAADSKFSRECVIVGSCEP